MEPQDLDPPDRIRPLRWAVLVLLAVGFAACIAKGANEPPDPRLVESRIEGFSEIGVQIQRGGELPSTTERCALLAATERQRARGLMEVTDLEGYVGMVFRFSVDSQGGFYMRNTPMPLSIAFFAADGRFVSAVDMAPCEDGPNCPIYSAAAPYRYALEVPQGKLGELGVGPGSTLVLSGACPDSGRP
ncbi:MAG: DUF192 domain-containing protein [Actinomycetota bacterium]|nr:DUF192 domain-containing protein [Actinomycetota bacterium]